MLRKVPAGAAVDAVPRAQPGRHRRHRPRRDRRHAAARVQHRQAAAARRRQPTRRRFRGRRPQGRRRRPDRRGQGRQGHGRRPGRRATSGSTSGSTGRPTSARRPSADVRIKTILGQKFLALDPAGTGDAGPARSRCRARRRRTTSCEAFSDLATTTEDDRHRPAGDRARHGGRHVPGHARGGPRRGRRARPAVPDRRLPRRSSCASCSHHANGVTGVLADRNEELVTPAHRRRPAAAGAAQAPRGHPHPAGQHGHAVRAAHRAGPRQPRGDRPGAGQPQERARRRCEANQANLDRSIQLLAPFVRVFANTTGNGRWFDTYIQNLVPVPGGPRERDMSRRSVVAARSWPLLAGWSRSPWSCWPGGGTTARARPSFVRAVGLYPGSDVRILGVQVGKVTRSRRRATGSRVDFDVRRQVQRAGRRQGRRRRRRPSSATATSSSRRSTRGGPGSPTARRIQLADTAVPVELDRIFSSLDDLDVALGPKGANKNGALSRLLAVGADNLDGRGRATSTRRSPTCPRRDRTLADGRDDLFGTVRNLQVFTTALASSDDQVRGVQHRPRQRRRPARRRARRARAWP